MLLMETIMTEELISPSQAASRANCHEDTIRRAIQSGYLPAQRVGQRTWAIKTGDLQSWIDVGMPNRRRKSMRKGEDTDEKSDSGTDDSQ
jgi:excisionase family DNA binding protein